jgi:hypothetical protein
MCVYIVWRRLVNHFIDFFLKPLDVTFFKAEDWPAASTRFFTFSWSWFLWNRFDRNLRTKPSWSNFSTFCVCVGGGGSDPLCLLLGPPSDYSFLVHHLFNRLHGRVSQREQLVFRYGSNSTPKFQYVIYECGFIIPQNPIRYTKINLYLLCPGCVVYLVVSSTAATT